MSSPLPFSTPSFSHSSLSLSSSSSSSSSSFILFRYLPPELRHHIYRYACHPRVVSLTYLPHEDIFRCPTHPPALLHVCRESRAEGLRTYIKCPLPSLHSTPSTIITTPTTTTTTTTISNGREGQGSNDGDDNDDNTAGDRGRKAERYFYFHPWHDTLYLPRPADPFGLGYAGWARELAEAAAATFAGAVRRLAVDYVPAEVRRPWEAYGKMCLIGGCPRLEEAYLVVSSSRAPATVVGEEERGCPCAEREEEEEEEEVELVDPGDADGEIAEIMERVRESFRVELGDGIAGLLRGALGKEEEEDNEGQRPGRRGGEVGLELIPKAKVPSPSWAGRQLVCAS